MRQGCTVPRQAQALTLSPPLTFCAKSVLIFGAPGKASLGTSTVMWGSGRTGMIWTHNTQHSTNTEHRRQQWCVKLRGLARVMLLVAAAANWG